MKRLIIGYLFVKALIWPHFDNYDIDAAIMMVSILPEPPSFLELIAGMVSAAYLPEARADIFWELFYERFV